DRVTSSGSMFGVVAQPASAANSKTPARLLITPPQSAISRPNSASQRALVLMRGRRSKPCRTQPSPGAPSGALLFAHESVPLELLAQTRHILTQAAHVCVQLPAQLRILGADEMRDVLLQMLDILVHPPPQQLFVLADEKGCDIGRDQRE